MGVPFNKTLTVDLGLTFKAKVSFKVKEEVRKARNTRETTAERKGHLKCATDNEDPTETYDETVGCNAQMKRKM